MGLLAQGQIQAQTGKNTYFKYFYVRNKKLMKEFLWFAAGIAALRFATYYAQKRR